MLRMSYMPSDFHPILLVLGSHTELARFAGILETFSLNGKAVDMERVDGVASLDAEVHLSTEGKRTGLWPDARSRERLEWTIDRPTARMFGETVRDLAQSCVPSGSVTLECDVLNEVKVKVSIGEFEEDFLVGDAR